MRLCRSIYRYYTYRKVYSIYGRSDYILGCYHSNLYASRHICRIVCPLECCKPRPFCRNSLLREINGKSMESKPGLVSTTGLSIHYISVLINVFIMLFFFSSILFISIVHSLCAHIGLQVYALDYIPTMLTCPAFYSLHTSLGCVSCSPCLLVLASVV